MKVLLVKGYLFGFMFDVASGLSRRGVEVHVAKKTMSILSKKRNMIVKGVHLHNFGRRIDPSIITGGLRNISELPPTAFFHPGSVAATVPYSWFITKLVKMYKIDLLHAVFAAPEGFAALLAKNVVKRPLVISVMGYDVQTDPQTGYGALSHRWTAEMVVKALTGADAIIVGENSHARTVMNLLGKEKTDKIFFIPGAIDVSCFNPFVNGNIVREKFNIASDQTVILSARHLDPIYGAEYLLRAASKIVVSHPKTIFLMLGSGPRKPLQELVQELKLVDNVIFVGKVHRSQMPSYYAASDIFCDPCMFGQGISSLEALASVKPVVGFRVGQIKIENRTDGFLVEPADVKGLADRILWLIEHPDARKKMGMKGRERIEKHHNLVDRINEILKIYDKLVDSYKY